MGCWHQGGGGGGVECEGHDVGVTIWTRALSAESEVECEVEVRSSAYACSWTKSSEGAQLVPRSRTKECTLHSA